MSYIENIFVCLAAPLILATICMRRIGKHIIISLIAGMSACLLSSYVSTFLAAALGITLSMASIEISPLVEEIMKLFPVIFYLLVFEPDVHDVTDACMMTAIGFATFENVCFLMQNGASNLLYLLIRGFGTGAMHVVCAGFIAVGLFRLWNRDWLRTTGTIALLALSMTYHGVYNILVSQQGKVAMIGYFIPVITVALYLLFGRKLYRQET